MPAQPSIQPMQPTTDHEHPVLKYVWFLVAVIIVGALLWLYQSVTGNNPYEPAETLLSSLTPSPVVSSEFDSELDQIDFGNLEGEFESIDMELKSL